MPVLSNFARKKKIKYFLKQIPKNNSILEIGSGSGWVGDYLTKNAYTNYRGIDIVPPADIVGDICQWKDLGIKEEYYDVVIAFEVLEHVNCIKECWEIIKPNGMLMVTTPVPHMDWLLVFLEFLGLNQKRTSPHNNLMYLKNVHTFRSKKIKIVMFLSQWGIFIKD